MPGLDEPRFFVAVWPPPAVLDILAALGRPDVGGLSWTARHQWHVTLRFLGAGVEPPAAGAALGGARLPPASAVLGPAVAPLGRRVVQVPVSGLDELVAAVEGATAALVAPGGARAFRGHLTLARCRTGGVDLHDVTGEGVAATWAVREVSLVASLPGGPRPRYEVLGRYPTAL